MGWEKGGNRKMEEKHVETKVVAKYAGHSVKANKSVDIALKCAYDQLTNYILLIQFLNVDVKMVAKLAGEKPFELGTFRVKEVKVDNDGEGTLKFNSMNDFVNADNFNKLVGSDLVNVKFSADIEVEEEDDEDEDTGDFDDI